MSLRRGEKVEVPPDKEKEIADEFMGAYFGMVCDMLDSKIITTSDFDLSRRCIPGHETAIHFHE